jgi:hypothetical protein
MDILLIEQQCRQVPICRCISSDITRTISFVQEVKGDASEQNEATLHNAEWASC